jgi:hypothetical protein
LGGGSVSRENHNFMDVIQRVFEMDPWVTVYHEAVPSPPGMPWASVFEETTRITLYVSRMYVCTVWKIAIDGLALSKRELRV